MIAGEDTGLIHTGGRGREVDRWNWSAVISIIHPSNSTHECGCLEDPSSNSPEDSHTSTDGFLSKIAHAT